MESKLKDTKLSLETKINTILSSNQSQSKNLSQNKNQSIQLSVSFPERTSESVKLSKDNNELKIAFNEMSQIIEEFKSKVPKFTKSSTNLSNLCQLRSEFKLNSKNAENVKSMIEICKLSEKEEEAKYKISHSVENLHANQNLSSSVQCSRQANKEDVPTDEESINILPTTPNCVKRESKFMKNRVSCIESKDDFTDADIEYSIDEVADPNGRKIYTNKHNMFKDFHQKRKLKNAKVKPRIETIRLDYDTIEQSKVLKTEESDIPEMMKMFDMQKNAMTMKVNNSHMLNENSPDCGIKVVTMYPKLLCSQSRSSSDHRFYQNRKNSSECDIRMKMLTNYKDTLVCKKMTPVATTKNVTRCKKMTSVAKKMTPLE